MKEYGIMKAIKVTEPFKVEIVDVPKTNYPKER